jgi:hypothetical protein
VAIVLVVTGVATNLLAHVVTQLIATLAPLAVLVIIIGLAVRGIFGPRRH